MLFAVNYNSFCRNYITKNAKSKPCNGQINKCVYPIYVERTATATTTDNNNKILIIIITIISFRNIVLGEKHQSEEDGSSIYRNSLFPSADSPH